MSDISTIIKTHVIVSTTNKHYFLTAEQHNSLINASLDDMVATVDGVSVKCSAILEVLPIQKYYEKYPDMQPHDYRRPYALYPGQGMIGIADQMSVYKIEKWIDALERSLVRMPNNQFLKEMLQRAKDMQSGKIQPRSKAHKPVYKNLVEYYEINPEQATPEKLAIAERHST